MEFSVVVYALIIILVVFVVIIVWHPWCVAVIKLSNKILDGLDSPTVSTQMCGRSLNLWDRVQEWAENFKPPKNPDVHINISPDLVLLVLVLVLILLILIIFGPLIYKKLQDIFEELWDALDESLSSFTGNRDEIIREAVPKSLQELLSSLQGNGNEIIRESAARSLGEMRSVEAGKYLGVALQHEKSQRVRLSIINALTPVASRLVGDPKNYLRIVKKYIVPELKKALYAENREEREAAVMTLLWIGTQDALSAIDVSSNSALPPKPIAKSNEDVQFSVYYPPEVQLNTQYTIYFYAYEKSNLLNISNDIKKSKGAKGNKVLRGKASKQSFQLSRNTPITVVPECDGIQFEPGSYTEIWNGNWTRFKFHFEPKGRSLNQFLLIHFSVRVRGVEIAHMVSKINVVEKILDNHAVMSVDINPLAAAKFNSHTCVPYQKIFVSYSRKDVDIVEMYRLAQEMLGNDIFVDTYSIRSGENWQVALANAIDTADVFQLFWSENSAKSPNVRDEWDYALKYKCPQTRCEDFIRPVYWVTPIPAQPPDALKHLNFRLVKIQG